MKACDFPMKISDCSFLYFVYPFLFEASTFDARAAAIGGAGKQGRNRLIPAWEAQQVHAEDLLPHVQQYLNPGQASLSGQPGPAATARLWKLGRDRDNPYRLSAEEPWQLLVKDRREGAKTGDLRPIPFRPGGTRTAPDAQLALFRVGVGLLTFHIRLDSEVQADWLDFLHYFRYTARGEETSVTAPPGVGGRFAGLGGNAASNFDAVLLALLETGSLLEAGNISAATHNPEVVQPQEGPRWWSEVFVPAKMLPFAALFADGEGGQTVPEDQQSEMRYRVKNFFRSGQEIRPGAYHLRDDQPGLLPYADGQDFLFSIEGGAFLAFDALPTKFFRETLPSHLRQEYFLLFLLTLHQRFALMGLSAQVAEKWPVAGGDVIRQEETFEAIRDSMLAFTARGYFAQAMQREHHHRCYLKWQETFQIPRLYEEVRDEVREMHEYLLMKQAKHLREMQKEQAEHAKEESEKREKREKEVDLLITTATLAVAIPALTFGFLAINIEAYKLTVAAAAWIAVGAFSVSTLTTFVIWWRRPTRKR